jgi:hypothetical protein
MRVRLPDRAPVEPLPLKLGPPNAAQGPHKPESGPFDWSVTAMRRP